ncbi:hypothetical protein [Sinorhizobium medicae]|uniref:hypothetical protein n=1 Tax=Sinorhizobium medicae TaxID=110321 RepID=UPI000C7B2B6F|nr:hypothetical protein [Sinorhizobium medicae]MDX0512750.1 hypothetical protein [Sinorhizobium medicae]MDX0937370.1 hypothetical protein [Sinorhizobium medicae]MDX0943523.1 hypothetical protein [Sinorhizobium medicae]MDX0949021.1 hypothetical protein [Sinorhizobium medicae]MDX1010710.1 hypothetical protein [Sinorhizobium medicae]
MKQMPGLDVLAAAEAIRMARSAMFIGMEVSSRLTDVLIAKGVLTRGEARSILYAMAESIRDDAGGTGSEESTEAIASYLEKVGDSFKA